MPRGPADTVTAVEIFEWVQAQDDPVVFAREVADQFNHSSEWARQRLRTLVEQDALSVKCGGKEKAYWPSVEE